MRADTGEVDHGDQYNSSQPVEEHTGGANFWWDIEVTNHQEREFDGTNEIANGDGFLSIWPLI